MIEGNKTKWLVEILTRARRTLATHRDRLSHAQAVEVRAVLVDIDAARLIAKEMNNASD